MFPDNAQCSWVFTLFLTHQLHTHSREDVAQQPSGSVSTGVFAQGTSAVTSWRSGFLGDGGWRLAVWGRQTAAHVKACGYLGKRGEVIR